MDGWHFKPGSSLASKLASFVHRTRAVGRKLLVGKRLLEVALNRKHQLACLCDCLSLCLRGCTICMAEQPWGGSRSIQAIPSAGKYSFAIFASPLPK